MGFYSINRDFVKGNALILLMRLRLIGENMLEQQLSDYNIKSIFNFIRNHLREP